MTRPKLVTFLMYLDKEELVLLKKFILTKTSKESDSFILINYLISRFDKLKDLYEIDKIAKKLFPNSSQKAVLNYLSTLTSWAEEWLAIYQMQTEEYTEDLMLIKWYNRRGNYLLSNHVAHRIEKKIEDENALDLEKVKAKCDLLHFQYYSNNPIKYEKGGKMFDELVANYIELIKSQMFLYLIEMKNLDSIMKSNFHHDFDELSKIIDQLADSEITKFSKSLFDMFTSDEIQFFCTLANLLLNHKIKPKTELHTLVINYLISKALIFYKKGKLNDKSLIAKLYNHGLETDAFIRYGKLSTATFHNIIMNLSMTSDFETVNTFIDNWTSRTNSKNIESTKDLARAQNCFYHKKYKEILKLTWRSDFETFNQKNLAQAIHTMATFMNKENDFETYQISINNSVKFLNRNKDKMSEQLFESYTNLFDFIKKMGIEKPKLVDLNEYEILIFKSWCEEVLASVKYKYKL